MFEMNILCAHGFKAQRGNTMVRLGRFEQA